MVVIIGAEFAVVLMNACNQAPPTNGSFITLLIPYSILLFLSSIIANKKSLKILKGESESVNRSSTDNTIANRKNIFNDLQYTTQKTKD